MQQYMTQFGAVLMGPLTLANAFCIGGAANQKSALISTTFFVSGVATLLQTTFGVRLPIVQGGSVGFMMSTLALLGTDRWRCPRPDTNSSQSPALNEAGMSVGFANYTISTTTGAATQPDVNDLFLERIREVSIPFNTRKEKVSGT